MTGTNNRNYEREHRLYLNAACRKLGKSENFEVQSSGGKLTWRFKRNSDGNLLVQAPMRLRWTKVLNEKPTIRAIVEGSDHFIMHVVPLPENDIDDEVTEDQMLVRIDQLCVV